VYSPEAFKITDEKIIEEFIAKNPFAILTSENNGKIEVTHLPINRFKDGKLYGHLAKANIHSNIDEIKEVCFIFNGEHAYISPTYYKTFNVSMWGKQKKNDGDEAKEELEEGEMPPWFYIIPHPEAKLSKSETKELAKRFLATFGEEKDD